MSPERPSSDHEEIPSTPKMSVPASPIALTPYRGAQSPISMLLAVAQGHKGPDDDLTSLNWLHERDVLKGMNINTSPLGGSNTTPNKGNTTLLSDQSPTSDYVDDSSINSTPESSICSSINSPQPIAPAPLPVQYQCRVSSNVCQNVKNRSRHPHNVPYDPQVHVNNKPPYSFSCLIFMAIEDSITKALPVKEIYAWIVDHFPYFLNAPTGWKNSVRHNLSLNKCFQKVEKAPNLGKGSLWTVDPQYKPNLIQALNRSPFYPCSVFDVSKYVNEPTDAVQQNSSVQPEKKVNRLSVVPPELFPFLSRKLTGDGDNGTQLYTKHQDDSLDAVDAAAVMLSLKHGSQTLQQIITNSPSQDHTYSAADSLEEQDEAFQSDEDKRSKTKTCRKIDFEDEEQRRIKEGAETLLNLAGITTRKRSAEYTDYDSPAGKMYREDFEQNGEKSTPFKPRLLIRAKRKSDYSPQKLIFNNNDNEWMRNRHELGIDLSTR